MSVTGASALGKAVAEACKVTLNAPVEVALVVSTVSVDVAWPLAGGVTVAGDQLVAAPYPGGRLMADKVTGELKPPWLKTVTAKVAGWPCVTMLLTGFAVAVKPGAAAAITVNVTGIE